MGCSLIMRRLIYRRDNISIALKQNEFTSGCNLYIWYGYIDNNSVKHDFIVDTSVIKEDMKADLREYDHLCIDVNDAYDIVDNMIEIGKMIFQKAMSHPLMNEIIVEDIYGDEVVIRNKQLIIHKKYLRNLIGDCAIFSCNDRQRYSLFGLKSQEFTCTCKENITEKQLQQLVRNEKNSMHYYVTCRDEAASVALTYYGKESMPEYITFCCIEHMAHQLPCISVSDKCGRLHGHTYRCYVAIKNCSRMTITSEYVYFMGKKIRSTLRTAFDLRKLSITTTENVISYVAEELCNEHELAFIELSETPNIKARIYVEETLCGEIV